MNSRNKTNAVCGLLVAVLAAGLIGCATSGYERSASMASSLQSSATKIDRIGLSLDNALAALDELVNNSQSDLRPQFKKFTNALKGLDSSSANIALTHNSTQVKSTSFFENWEREIRTIQNRDIREQSDERKQQVEKQFDRVKAACDELNTKFKPLVNDLSDIQTALGSDLTSNGLAVIKPTTQRINQQATPRRTEINALAEQFRELAAAVSPKAGAPQ